MGRREGGKEEGGREEGGREGERREGGGREGGRWEGERGGQGEDRRRVRTLLYKYGAQESRVECNHFCSAYCTCTWTRHIVPVNVHEHTQSITH